MLTAGLSLCGSRSSLGTSNLSQWSALLYQVGSFHHNHHDDYDDFTLMMIFSHGTETTHWDHPELVNTFKSLIQFNTIR